MPRQYRLGRRQPSVDRTATAILGAARNLVAESGERVSLAAVARRAGVSRITVYNRFGSRASLLEAIAPTSRADAAGLREYLEQSAAASAAHSALFRNLRPEVAEVESMRRICA